MSRHSTAIAAETLIPKRFEPICRARPVRVCGIHTAYVYWAWWRMKWFSIGMKRTERTVVPKFKTEAEEAQWWYDNRDKVEEALIAAMDNGTIQRGTAQRLAGEVRTSRNVTIRMAEADLDLARKQAEEKGLPYQTYI